MVETGGMKLTETDSADIQSLIAQPLNKDFPENSFQHIFWEEQRKFNALKNKRQMRWHPLIIRYALALKYSSTSAYRLVSGYLSLPSERTLRDYTHWCSVSDGVQIPFIEHARKTLNESGISKLQLQFTLLMDEMKIKQGLVFSKSTKEIIGFTNLSTVNHELSILTEETDSSTESSLASYQIAKQMLVFMIRPIFKPSLSFLVALYPSSNRSGEELYPVVMEVVEALELWALPVLAITSDGASPNRKFYKLCKLYEEFFLVMARFTPVV